MNTQLVPPSSPLLTKLPSGRDIHPPPTLFKLPSLDDDTLVRMRAPLDDTQVAQVDYNLGDSEEESIPIGPGEPLMGAPGRSGSASNVYY